MDLSYTPEAEEFRTEITSWLAENLPDGWFDEGFEMSEDERKAVQRRVAEEALRGGLDLRHLAGRIRRQGAHHDAGRGAGRGVRQCEGADARRLLRRHARRAHAAPMGERGAEEAVPARHPQRHDPLVPGILRAELRFRPRQSQDDCGARRRRMGDQRTEGVDDPGSPRRLLLPAHPHRPERLEARRHLLHPRADAPGRHRGPRHHPARRHRRVLRGVLRQRALRRRTMSSAASTTAGRWPTRRSRSSAVNRPPRATGASPRSTASWSSRRRRTARSTTP